MSERFGLWGFEMRDAVSCAEKARPARVKRLDAHFMGTEQEATTLANEMHTDFVVNNPDAQVEVKAVFLEDVGPVTKKHLEQLGAQAEANQALARFIAARMAPYIAKEQLQLNPNLENIAQGIVEQSRQMLAVMQQQAQKQKIAVLDLGGKMVRSGGRA